VTVRFLEIAESELDDAIRWYQAQAPGLGEAFLLEVMTTARRIARYPGAWQLLEQDIRRCRLTRFPYGLIYAVERNDIVVLAVAHLHRKPGYWRERVKPRE
jgi:plasmid stabilization system protein ParE